MTLNDGNGVTTRALFGSMFRTILLVTVFSAATAQPPLNASTDTFCLSSKDCARTGNCGQAFCMPGVRKCIFSREAFEICPGAGPRRSRENLLDEVNADVSFNHNVRLDIVDVAIKLFAEVHPHRPLHLNLVGIDPVARLQQVRSEVLAANGTMSNAQFFDKMIHAYSDVDDYTSIFHAPPPLRESLAYLPLTIVDYYEPRVDESRANLPNESSLRPPSFIVSDVALGFTISNASFKQGVQVVEWNGTPILEAVQMAGKIGSASNEAAKFRDGVSLLIERQLAFTQFPDRDAAEIGYVGESGEIEYVSIEWLYFTESLKDNENIGAVRTMGSIHPGNLGSAVRQSMIKGRKTGRDGFDLDHAARMLGVGQRMGVPIEKTVANVFQAEIIRTSSGLIGRIRIFTFLSDNVFAFVSEYERLLVLLPTNGLIIDLRGNGGGLLLNYLYTAGLLANGTFDLLTASYRVTKATLDILNQQLEKQGDVFEFGLYARSANFAARIGDLFTTDLEPIGSDFLQGFQGIFQRPTVVVTDGSSYGAGELVPASFIDNEIGVVVGVDDLTAGGGSFDVSYTNFLQQEFPDTFPVRLPANIDFRTPLRRLLRTGKNKGLTPEYVGVKPDVRYYPTLNDRRNSDKDLVSFLGDILDQMR